ncbi:proline dehydrogenase [Roseospira marina]|uniref:Proline dehydrogenase n=1 Tax=Roseospira marina TaxID=140057 RepID=A0A5M6IBJ1_9PROT|nr:proline dehydrogenase family protein [Roseospira marina]KAA5605664.1 proline dehydrogenase [Roseospira marina]MBB4313258.1 proline dehydrogenase [Roseospira marina]MBB5086001.1 proline dehydrogenase [Roseospira marina]
MFARLWQSAMIALARSPRVTHFMQTARITAGLRDRFVASGDATDAVARAQALFRDQGLRSSLFYLGEYVDQPALVDENVAAKQAVIQALRGTGLDVHVSVDMTQVGHLLDPALAARHLDTIAETLRDGAADAPPDGLHVLMLDMEDPSVVDATIALHDGLADRGLPVALTLQAYLKRTEADLDAQIRRGGAVRLVKGAFVGTPAIAYTRRADIKANSRRLIDRMFSAEARAAGFYPIVATHDARLTAYTRERARAGGWPPGSYEFEMLLGVREPLARALVAEGERVRLYVPFGRDWWPYSVRRIGENPANAWLLTRSLVG